MPKSEGHIIYGIIEISLIFCGWNLAIKIIFKKSPEAGS
jgi:hypothetical protein